jgi:hypothetical protein
MLGGSEAFLSALHDYQVARLHADEELEAKARQKGIVAILDLGIDGALLFGGALSLVRRQIGIVATQVIIPAYLGRIGRCFGAGEFDVIAPLAERLDRNPRVQALMRRLFGLVRKGVTSAAS